MQRLDYFQKHQAAYIARRIIRATPGGATDKRLRKLASPFVMQLVDVLPKYLSRYCIAKAEDLAIEEIERSK